MDGYYFPLSAPTQCPLTSDSFCLGSLTTANHLDPVYSLNATLKAVHNLDLLDFDCWDRSDSCFQCDGPKVFSTDGYQTPERLSALVARCIAKAGFPSGLISLHSCRAGFLLKAIALNMGNPGAMSTAWVHSKYAYLIRDATSFSDSYLTPMIPPLGALRDGLVNVTVKWPCT